jgi:diguanylate cyclase (GGDEF)-like protein
MSEQAAGLLSLALAKFQAVEQAERRAEESETLRRAGAAISETLDLHEATTRLLEQLAFIPHDSASVQLLSDGELEIIAAEGWREPSKVIGLRFPVPGDNPNTRVLQTRKPYLLNEADESFPTFRRPPHDHIHSWLGVPLLVHGRAIGLLAIDSKESHHFTPDDIELVMAFAGQVAVAIENARLFDEVQQLAITDSLTGLHNRRHFLYLAQTEFERARRYKRHLSAMVFDIDHFKTVNDTYGHPIGDKVLRAIADLCREQLREADPIGRYGGEEFVAIIVEANGGTAFSVGERLRASVEKIVIPSADGDVRVTVSVGIAEQDEGTPNLETLIARADQAMYVSKHKGRNRVSVGS